MQRICIVVAVLILVPALAVAQTISGTSHDLSGRGWGSNELCVFCHTPHNATTAVTVAPLWNHGVTTVGNYGTYTSPTMNATVGQPGDISKLCLSCHDGTVAIDSYGGVTGTHFMTGGALVGTDLSNDHPVGITYDAALSTADGGLKNPTTPATIAPARLFAGRMECASCHNAHSNQYTSFLRGSNSGSALCLACHTK